MSTVAYPVIENEALTLRPVSTDGRLEVRLTGNADLRVMGELDAALKELHKVVMHQGLREVAFDIRELYFMNSACFGCFATFIVTVFNMPKAQQYPIVFLSNTRMHWQDRSLDALRSLATDIVRIEAS